jgi:anti-sigma regulatory factor (Ser/Thr protein kinase)
MTVRTYPGPRLPGETIAYLDLDALPNAPHWARSLTRSSLRAWRLSPDLIDTAELLVSELVTNSVKACNVNSRSATYPEVNIVDRISLTLRHSPGRIIVEVFDIDQCPPLLSDADTEDESGRGLMLVEALSKEWGYFFTPTGGKVVYTILSA